MNAELKQRAKEAIEQLAALDGAKKPGAGTHGQVCGMEPYIIHTNGFALQCLHDAQWLIDELVDPFNRRINAQPVAWVSDCIDGDPQLFFDKEDAKRSCAFIQPLYTSAPQIPEGMALVPVEPTEEMLFACIGKPEIDMYVNDAEKCYKAMIAAAQQKRSKT